MSNVPQYFYHPCINNHNFIIRANSPLFTFIHARFPNVKEKSILTMNQVLSFLKDIISKEMLFDQRNPTMIICEKGLDQLFHAQAFHTSDIKNVIFNHVLRLPDSYQESKFKTGHQTLLAFPYRTIEPPIIIPDDGKLFAIDQKLWTLFNTVLTKDQFETTKTVYRLKEIVDYCYAYIKHRGTSIVDPNNRNIIVLKNDPLGEIFQVDYMHIKQCCTLLQPYLYEYDASIKRIKLADSSSSSSEPENDPIEYSIEEDSGEERQRPHFAGGQKSDESSEPQEPYFKNRPNIPALDKLEPVESEEEGVHPPKQSQRRQQQKCIGCGNNQVLVTFCSSCWERRKQWLPVHCRKQKRPTTIPSEPIPNHEDCCTTCLIQPVDATFIHGNTGHCICCYSCAIKIWTTNKSCPVCNRTAEKIVKIFKP